MDKSVPPNEPQTDAPTVKTEPTRPATEADAPPAHEEAAPTGAIAGAGPSEAAPPAEPQAASTEQGPTENETHPAAAKPRALDAETSPAGENQVSEGQVVEQVAAQAASMPLEQPVSERWQPLAQRFDRQQVHAIAVRTGKVAVLVFCGWFAAVVILIAIYRFANPPFSTLMAMQWLTGTQIKQTWEPIEDISPNLVRAVITSEDSRFCRHWGIDFVEILHAIERSSGGVPRGASTISMQVAKNLFLWPSKSYVRKAIEVPVTYAIELLWTKRRIIEVYLNIAEWGPGIFGAQAASQAHFGRSASKLTSNQAARLAVALPNPFIRDAGDPGPWTRRHAGVIQRRAAASPENAACVLSSR